MSKSAMTSGDTMKSLLSRLDAMPGVTERLGILEKVQFQSHRKGSQVSFTHWDLLKEAFARELPFGPRFTTVEGLCVWTKDQESNLEVARKAMDERKNMALHPEFPIAGVAACAAVHRDTLFLQRMYKERVLRLDRFRDSIFAILTVAGLLRVPELVKLLLEWQFAESLKWQPESVGFDAADWESLLRAALWTGNKEWSQECRTMIDKFLYWDEFLDVEVEALEVAQSFPGPNDIMQSWRSIESRKLA